ncbi:unnamed protein product [Paramecium octaurelia]|uniref:cysteine--tRNA ligase n=1 Tax=Paramecium octaurelia TaxID=43137 RepID=A0A8S1YI27_PAROT|nr:unnamed protein product [Paramecium octaurelia]
MIKFATRTINQFMQQQKDLFAHYKQPSIKEDSYVTGLKLANSLKGSELVPFIPINGRQVNFYYCGPTVYSNSHLGHARTYLGIDVIRRTLRDYFNYDLLSVMNITDIDDKIINGAKQAKQDFLEFTKVWEKDFFSAMEALNIELPDVITRVSDYVPEIVTFIEKIIANGYAYESNGSVYFDVHKYLADGHTYPKMRPEMNADLLQEGEGESQANKQSEKRSPNDFALWKASKPEEPKWPSPWGEGRPGWHIECSVMASAILGNPIDLHAGGIDLIFPHHDNSLAQAEACFNCDQWINYFIHLGHLNIADRKMSKSLKNFLTIEEVLKRYTPRQIRLNFAIHQYDAVMNYSEEQVEQAISKDKAYQEFFQNTKIYLRESEVTGPQKWTQNDFQISNLLRNTKQIVHAALLKNFDFPTVVDAIDKLINQVNVQIAGKTVKAPLVQSVVQYVDFILGLLGLNYLIQNNNQTEIKSIMAEVCSIRDQVKLAARKGEFEAISNIVTLKQFQYEKNLSNGIVDYINQFQQQVLAASQEKNKQQLFSLCDKLRDEQLFELGIKIEDKDKDQPSIWKQYDPKELKLEKEQQQKLIQQKELIKKKEEEKKKQEELEKLEKAKIHPKDMFLSQVDKYSEFDEKGIPVKDKEGNELSKKQKKVVQELWEKQNKIHNQYLETLKKQQQQ